MQSHTDWHRHSTLGRRHNNSCQVLWFLVFCLWNVWVCECEGTGKRKARTHPACWLRCPAPGPNV